MQTLVRLDGAVEQVLERLVGMGYFKTRSEAIRAGILELGKEYGAVKRPQEIEDELVIAKVMQMDAEIKSGKKKLLTLEDVRKKYPEAFE